MRMITGQETLAGRGIEKERNLHLTGGGEAKSVAAVMIKEMTGDPGILEVEAQEDHLDPQAVVRTTTVAEMRVEEEVQKRTSVRIVAAMNTPQAIQDVQKDKNSASFVSRSTMTMRIVTIARTPLLASSVEGILIINLKIAHVGNRINFARKRMTSVALAKKDR